ncbi:MAG: YaeQ family protein [Dokdonella sp.]|uniref:YaeQ family protein n=1 Tax=Dokdonella sp. TaxID=2291710 RepID=UPI002C934EA5|nr:YaeQ family protein [Xanthomonadales bacterium]HQV73740.1 YaeQ family protein [Dokdonella sp.]MBK7211045.1 YaeQ family protein [Xanthomonadales bacterium]HQX66582.1 YaeQ family protein [Dokdonella sp.]HQY54868.1 YaeQ family protein [Dokdonella sp.]
MAPNATIYKVELQISDMDRNYYATHALTLARHPSETDERMMIRVLAFALYADDRLEFGKGLSTDDEPDLWRREMNGDIGLWIDLGHPDPARVRKACGRSRLVVLINYGGRGGDIWWEKSANELRRSKNLTILDIPVEAVDALAALAERGLRLQCLIQDGHVQILKDDTVIGIDPQPRLAADLSGRWSNAG